MAKDTAVVGIDLGGTNVRLALVSPGGEILARWERATATMPHQNAIISTLAKDLGVIGDDARSRQIEIKAVGFGIPGRILSQAGRVAFSPNIPALNDCPLVEYLQPKLPWPVFLENDANLFALGEHWLGAGAGHQNLLGITLGTGVGGGLILNGRLWQGTQGTTGEIGHITVEPEGQKCHCGNRGCLETLASASLDRGLGQGATGPRGPLLAPGPVYSPIRTPSGARPWWRPPSTATPWPGGPSTGWVAASGWPSPRWSTSWASPG